MDAKPPPPVQDEAIDRARRVRDEEESARKARELEAILDILPVGVWRADSRCEQVVGNRVAYEMLGLPHGINAAVGATPDNADMARLTLLVDGKPVPIRQLPLQRAVFAGESIRHLVHDIVLASGEQRSFDVSVEPLRDEQGAIVGAVAAHVDITAQKRVEAQLRESAAELRLVADNVPAFILRLDAQLRYRFVNHAYAERFGMQPEDMTGKALEEVIGAEAFAVTRPYLLRVLAGESVQYESAVPYARIGQCFMRSSNVPVRDAAGNVTGLIGVLVDLTERQRVEDALRDADRRKDQFLATLAHELRNPLNAISHAVELLNVAGGCDERTQRARDIIRRQMNHTVRLIDDLLEVGRITSGKIQLRTERVDLNEVIEHAVEGARATIERAMVDLRVARVDTPIWVEGDRALLAQVIANLLDNACKFTPEGGWVFLSAGLEGAEAVVRVSDSGIGIAAEDLDRVFDMFAQVASPLKGPQQGLGIGLSFSRRLMVLHHGSIEARSAGIGQGSEFVLRLPAAPALPPGDAREPVQENAAAGTVPLHVLVVDDNPDNVEMLAMLLRSAGHCVHVAYDGKTALAQAQALRPEAVLLDIGLPMLDGYEVCRAIRSAAWGRRMRVVAMTGWGQDDDRSRSKAAGFDAHLVKPVTFDDLMRTLEAG